MGRSVQHTRERQRRDCRRVVARLQQVREPLLAQPLELVFRERRPERDVGHDRQRLGEPRDRHVQAHRRGVDAGRGAQIGAEEIDRVGDLERRPRARTLGEHCRREAGDAELARRIVGGAAGHEEVLLDHRHPVHLDHPHRQAVRELPLLDRGEMQHWRRSRRGWMRAIGCLLRGERGDERSGGERKPVSHMLRPTVVWVPASRSARRGDPSAGTLRRQPARPTPTMSDSARDPR